MSLIIALGSNLNNPLAYLREARKRLQKHFHERAASSIYESPPVDYFDQPNFLNQVIEYDLPLITPEECLCVLQSIETQLGRERIIAKGPRTIDLDIIFWGTKTYCAENLIIPHPSWHSRAFIVQPLHELPFFQLHSSTFCFDCGLLDPPLQRLIEKNDYHSALPGLIIRDSGRADA